MYLKLVKTYSFICLKTYIVDTKVYPKSIKTYSFICFEALDTKSINMYIVRLYMSFFVISDHVFDIFTFIIYGFDSHNFCDYF